MHLSLGPVKSLLLTSKTNFKHLIGKSDGHIKLKMEDMICDYHYVHFLIEYPVKESSNHGLELSLER